MPPIPPGSALAPDMHHYTESSSTHRTDQPAYADAEAIQILPCELHLSQNDVDQQEWEMQSRTENQTSLAPQATTRIFLPSTLLTPESNVRSTNAFHLPVHTTSHITPGEESNTDSSTAAECPVSDNSSTLLFPNDVIQHSDSTGTFPGTWSPEDAEWQGFNDAESFPDPLFDTDHGCANFSAVHDESGSRDSYPTSDYILETEASTATAADTLSYELHGMYPPPSGILENEIPVMSLQGERFGDSLARDNQGVNIGKQRAWYPDSRDMQSNMTCTSAQSAFAGLLKSGHGSQSPIPLSPLPHENRNQNSSSGRAGHAPRIPSVSPTSQNFACHPFGSWNSAHIAMSLSLPPICNNTNVPENVPRTSESIARRASQEGNVAGERVTRSDSLQFENCPFIACCSFHHYLHVLLAHSDP